MPSSDRFHCHCGKSFIRKEHLKRHAATHSRPSHACDVCGRRFSRGDLLRRHAALHDGPQATEPRRARACDACHGSKVRCDGSETCSLCRKRRTACTYRRGRPAGAGEDGASGEGTVSEEGDPSGEEAGDDSLTGGAASRGLQTMLDILRAPGPLGHHDELAPGLAPVQDWWNACYDIYLSDFHPHWPVIHAPSWHEARHTVRWPACVALVATWSRVQPGAEVLSKALELHEVMVSHTMQALIAAEVDPEGIWPHETWIVALINAAVAVETGRETLIARARRLFALLVQDCRARDAFCTAAIEAHQMRHQPGRWRPWVFAHRELMNRLAVAIFRLDASFTLLDHAPPLIRRDELDVRLPVPLALFNAFGLDTFFARCDREPSDRKTYQVAQLLRCASPRLRPGVLFEDVQLMLCDLAQGAWQVWRARRMDGSGGAGAVASAPMLVRLARCEEHLRLLDEAVRTPARHPEVWEYVLWSYSCEERVGETGSRESVERRVKLFQHTTQLLWHTVNIHAYADVQGLRETLLRGPAADGADGGGIRSWTRSQDGRIALLHALAALATFQDLTRRAGPLPTPPTAGHTQTAHTAIADAGLVLLAHSVLGDTEHTVPQPIIAPTFALRLFGLRADETGELGLWVRSGGWAMVDGETVPGPSWCGRWCLAVRETQERWPLLKPIYKAVDTSLQSR